MLFCNRKPACTLRRALRKRSVILFCLVTDCGVLGQTAALLLVLLLLVVVVLVLTVLLLAALKLA